MRFASLRFASSGVLLLSLGGCPNPPDPPTTTEGDSGGSDGSLTDPTTPTGGPVDPRDFCGSVLQEIPWIESDSVLDPGGLLGSCCDFSKVGDFEAKLIGETFWPCQVALDCSKTNPHPFYGICTRVPTPPRCGEFGLSMCFTPPEIGMSCESLGLIALCDSQSGEFCQCADPFPDPPPMCSIEATSIGCPLFCTGQGFLCEPDSLQCCSFAGVGETTAGDTGGTDATGSTGGPGETTGSGSTTATGG